LLPGAIAAEQGVLFAGANAQGGLSGGIGRMSHRVTAPGLEILTHLDEDVVRSLAHQRDQLSAIFQVDRAYAVVRLGVGRAVPPGPQPSRLYSPMVISV
jgi:hypothetical protein